MRSNLSILPAEPTPEGIRKAGNRYAAPKVDAKTQRRNASIKSVWSALDVYLTPDEIRAGDRLERHIIGALHKGHAYGSGRWLDEEESSTEFAVTRHSQECARARNEIGLEAYAVLEQMVHAQFTELGHLAVKPEEIGRKWLGCKQRGQAHIAGIAYIKSNLGRLDRMWQSRQGMNQK